MKKQLILTAGIVLSACSNNAYQNGGNTYDAPQYMGGSYQMNAGCAPVQTPMPCTNPRPMPCATPAPVPTPCSAVPMLRPRVGVGATALLHSNVHTPPSYPVQVHNVALAHHMGGVRLRPAYVARNMPYTYGELGAVNYDAGKNMGGLQTRLGYQSAGLLGAEIEGSLGLLDRGDLVKNDFTATNEKKKIGVDNSMAAFAVARTSVADRVKAFARVGYHKTKVKTAKLNDGSGTGGCTRTNPSGCGPVKNRKTTGGAIEDYTNTTSNDAVIYSKESFDGLAFGVGTEMALSPVESIRADITAYDMGAKYSKALSLGYQRKF